MPVVAGYKGDMERQSALIAMNIRWLRQAQRLLERLDDKVYSSSAPGFAPHRAGAHLRHVLEFYQCFLEGLRSGQIDYDARRRDESIERRRETAAEAIDDIVYALESRIEARQEHVL